MSGAGSVRGDLARQTSGAPHTDLEPVIGLEVHAQLLTESKIFCGCSTRFGAEPNANTCPVCTGMPGVLPVLNRRVVDFALRVALATNCTIERHARWARKNYFYPDLPKGYQISMYELPIATNGYIDIPVDGISKQVRLTRIHMEEDAGKNIHDVRGDASLVDLNRAGVPLLEIVSEPDIHSEVEAGAYLRILRAVVQYLEVCDGNMEEGSFRCDANISMRPRGSTTLGVKVEIKNMNSFRAVERALAHEISRQVEIMSEGGTIVQETRLWDADRQETRSMRTKEFAHDYRYFPDPDLLPLIVDQGWIDEIRSSLPELPTQRRARFVEQYGLPEDAADELTVRKDVADYFEEAVRHHPNPKSLSNWVRSDLMRVVRERRLDDALSIKVWPVPGADLGRLVSLIDAGAISGKMAKSVWAEMLSTQKSPDAIVEEQGLVQVTDRGAVESAVDRVLSAHPEKVAEYRGGKEKLLGFFVGQVMKTTKGAANPALVNELLKVKLRG